MTAENTGWATPMIACPENGAAPVDADAEAVEDDEAVDPPPVDETPSVIVHCPTPLLSSSRYPYGVKIDDEKAPASTSVPCGRAMIDLP